MKVKKMPYRSCIVSREKLLKKDLIRVVRTPEGEIVVDLTGKVNGRGAYLKRDLEIFNKAKTSKILEKHLEVNIPDEIFEELGSLIK